jgi:predicted DNA-binding ribbon-helix-helix protein
VSRADVRWCVADIADAIEVGLTAHIDLDRCAQSVRGIDALHEVGLHPILASALEDAGFGVHREQRYIGARSKRSRSEGRRCDLVLTPDGRPLQDPAATATLFDDPNAVRLEEAFWLEVKTVAQHTEMGPNQTWSSELLGTVLADVAKLANATNIFHAALVIVLWVESVEVAEHDLGVWQDRCIAKGLPIAAPSQRVISIQDRLGNAHCVLRAYPVMHL